MSTQHESTMLPLLALAIFEEQLHNWQVLKTRLDALFALQPCMFIYKVYFHVAIQIKYHSSGV